MYIYIYIYISNSILYTYIHLLYIQAPCPHSKYAHSTQLPDQPITPCFPRVHAALTPLFTIWLSVSCRTGLQVRSGPKMGHCGQRGSEENTANTSKNGPELYIVIARNVLGTAQNTVNYGKICVFAFLGRCVSSLASGDGGHKTLQIALKLAV